MKKASVLIMAVLAFILAGASLLGGCAPTAVPAGLKVVTSTSLIAAVVEQVGGDRVDVVNIIPPAQCPGHFDVKPGDIQKLADADLFLLHGWQGELFSESLIASADNPGLTVSRIDIAGNWMTPLTQQEATAKITAVLCGMDAEGSHIYQKAAEGYKQMISLKDAELKAKLSRLDPAGIKVMCSEQLTGLVKWAGFNVVATYGRPDSLIPQVVRELVDTGREAGVTLIIDNLQSGQDAGAGIAEELGLKRIILSNFPGGFDGAVTWEETIDKNVELIAAAVD